jgi:hypothetical protein
LPYRFWGAGRWRNAAIFLGGTLSVIVSAVLALSELLMSGIPMPSAVLGLSLGLFFLSALFEGAITLAVVKALEAMNAEFVRRPERPGAPVLGSLLAVSVVLAAVIAMFASTNPDGIAKLAQLTGIAERATTLIASPFGEYETAFVRSPWLRKASAGIAGLALIYAVCALFGRVVARVNRSA